MRHGGRSKIQVSATLLPCLLRELVKKQKMHLTDSISLTQSLMDFICNNNLEKSVTHALTAIHIHPISDISSTADREEYFPTM